MLDAIKKQVEQILDRNKRVEREKSWEVSKTRKCAIMVLTYIVVVLFFVSSGNTQPFLSAIVPTMGYFLSTLSLPYIKKRWMQYYYSA